MPKRGVFPRHCRDATWGSCSLVTPQLIPSAAQMGQSHRCAKRGLRARCCPYFPGAPSADTQTPLAPLVLQRSSTRCSSRSRGTAKATRCRLPTRARRARPRRRWRSASAVSPCELAGHAGWDPAAPGRAGAIELGLPPHRPVAGAGATEPAVPLSSWCHGDQQPRQWPNSALNSEKHQRWEPCSVCFICVGLPAPLDPQRTGTPPRCSRNVLARIVPMMGAALPAADPGVAPAGPPCARH